MIARTGGIIGVQGAVSPGDAATSAVFVDASIPVSISFAPILAPRPDPVLRQIEDHADGTMSLDDTIRPVSAQFDRIAKPERLLTALPRAFATMTDPQSCVPVALAFYQDVQAEAHGIPVGETQPRKSALHWNHPLALGGIGASSSDAVNASAKAAKLVIDIGIRFQDFTTGS